MNPSNGSSLLTDKGNATLRPRTRRLISVEDDIYATDGSEGGLSRSASRTASRNPSPTPRLDASITSSSRVHTAANPLASFERSLNSQPSRSSRNTPNAFSGIWGNSWSAIQGIAANVMGSDDGSTDPNTRKRRSLHGRRVSSSAPPPKSWGPAGAGSSVGAGTHEEREAMVRVMKRKDLLTASEHIMPDSVGRIKRRNSDDRGSASALCDNDDRDALVYVHHVRSQDTLAGLSIKYNCQQTVLRKSNRMWPNDSVQTKKTVVLPVDACGVKGRPVQGPEALPDEDILLGDFGDFPSNTRPSIEPAGLPNGWHAPKRSQTESSSSLPSTDPESPWKHDSWVLLPNDKRPTQIGRMPRKALGFFPPARRKSLVYSDASTPRASMDLPRSSTSTNPNTSSPSQSARPRASSTLTSVSNQTHQRNPPSKTWGLYGPGGVGTLGRNVRSPGPAQDGLNKNFAQYLPSVAPPPGQEYFTPWAPSLLDASTGTSSQHGGSGAITPIKAAGMDLQDIGGAIEGWVRKVGTQAQKLLTEPGTPGQGKRSAVPVLGAVGGDMGDLIELQSDAFEIGDDEQDDMDRGRSRVDDILASTSERSMSRVAQQYQSARPEVNLVLRERARKSDGGK